MSTVNQMLKDLNARAANPNAVVSDETFAPKATTTVNPLMKYWIGTACFGLFAVVFATYSFTANKYQQARPVLPEPIDIVAATQAAVIPTVTAALTPEVAPNSVQIEPIIVSPIVTPPPPAPSMSISKASDELALSASTLAKPVSPSSMKINTSNGEIRFIAGLQDKARLALQSNDVDTAISALQALLSAKPMDHNSRLLLARLYYQSSQPDIALNLLQVAPNNDDLDVDFLSFRASLYTEAAEHRHAIDDYNVLSRLEPKNVRWQLGIAIAYDQLNDYVDAKFAYEQVKLIRDLPTNVDSFVNERISILKDLI